MNGPEADSPTQDDKQVNDLAQKLDIDEEIAEILIRGMTHINQIAQTSLSEIAADDVDDEIAGVC